MSWELSVKTIMSKFALALMVHLLPFALMQLVFFGDVEMGIVFGFIFTPLTFYCTYNFWLRDAFKMINCLKLIKKYGLECTMVEETPLLDKEPVRVTETFIWRRHKNYCLPLKCISNISVQRKNNRQGMLLYIYVMTDKGDRFLYDCISTRRANEVQRWFGIAMEIKKRASYIRLSGFETFGHSAEAHISK